MSDIIIQLKNEIERFQRNKSSNNLNLVLNAMRMNG